MLERNGAIDKQETLLVSALGGAYCCIFSIFYIVRNRSLFTKGFVQKRSKAIQIHFCMGPYGFWKVLESDCN